ncbi:uncharacterized protein RSE6_14831 [Rhynchosporium secalis]|uniref:Uncharacterized protein n=1 Tax=Rhynchosporium secalis TaxID=38038 RepID=A0A1E1MWA4_RHYSE|nr:uncharacterized protein RSE6_14831 [Rhynchosporium secalis]
MATDYWLLLVDIMRHARWGVQHLRPLIALILKLDV